MIISCLFEQVEEFRVPRFSYKRRTKPPKDSHMTLLILGLEDGGRMASFNTKTVVTGASLTQ